jgi:hypothetical protein
MKKTFLWLASGLSVVNIFMLFWVFGHVMTTPLTIIVPLFVGVVGGCVIAGVAVFVWRLVLIPQRGFPRILQVVTLVLIALGVAVAFLVHIVTRKDYVLAKLDAGDGILLTVLIENGSWDPMLMLYYTVHRGKDVLVQKHSFGLTVVRKFHFRLVTSQKEKLVALTEEDSPDRTLVMYDVESGQVWPFEGGQEDIDCGEELLKKLQTEYPSRKLILLSQQEMCPSGKDYRNRKIW